jgi:Tfp pilus assembly protein PilP
MSHRAHRLAMPALCALGVLLAGVGAAQQPQPQTRPPAAEAPAQEPATAQPESTPGPDIDQILEGEEEVLSGSGFTYDPGNRRDPFKSLLVEQQAREFRGPRPEGIPGLLIDEIDLTGVWRTGKGYVAQVVASNQKKTYLLKEGDQLYDGDVVSINKKEIVFKQIVQDPTALKPFREVVKSLSPS